MTDKKTDKVKFDKFANDLAKQNQETMDAYMKSCGTFMKGFEELTRAQMAFTQSLAEKQMKYFNDALKIKTLNEWSEVQNVAAQETFNEVIDAATKMSEKYVKVATDSFEPLNTQLEKSLKKATESVAA
jgi:phasin family protein